MVYIPLLGVVWNAGLFMQSLCSLYLLKKQIPQNTKPQDIHIYAVIAIRNEEISHVRECIEYFLSQSISKLLICLTEINDDHSKYIPLIQEFQNQDDRITYTTFTGNEGYKAEQVNVALSNIRNSKENVIVGIYDVDSRPDQRVFDYVKNNKIQVGQQFTLYDANLNDLNPLSLAGALHQTSWALGFETFNFFFPNRRLVYTVGHGIFISSDTLKTCGLFDEKCMTEDLMYGYKASVAKQNFHVIPYFEHAKFVKTAREFISQSSRWYAGELELISRFQGWYDNFNGRLSDKLKLYWRVVELLWWPLERLLYVFTIIGAFAGFLSLEIALLYTGVLILSGYVSAFTIIKSRGWNSRLVFAPFLVPLWHMVSVAGPLYALIKKIIGSSITWTVTKK